MTDQTVARRAVLRLPVDSLLPALQPRCKIESLVRWQTFIDVYILSHENSIPLLLYILISVALNNKFHAAGGGSMRIGVIKEEADEQMTLVSMKSDKKPHVQSIFSPGPPPPSAPVAVPGMEHSRNGEIFSCSAPITGGVLEGSNGESTNDRRYAPDSRLVL